jgi:hypothetical protein
VSSKPGQNLLRSVCRNENLRRPGERDPAANERLERSGLPSALRPSSWASTSGSWLGGGRPRRDEAKPPEDPPRLMGREISPVESGQAAEHLLRRKPPSGHDYIVLPHRIWKLALQYVLDVPRLELELQSCNSETRHVPKCIL